MHTDDRRPDKDAPGGPAAADDERLPAGVPEPPDMARVEALRRRLRSDRAAGGGHHRTPLHDRLGRNGGKAARDIGSYTLIPMMMVVGPVIGYLMGHYVEGRFGGEPWPGVVGIMFGLAAAVRQIVLMLQKRSEDKGDGPA